MPTYWMVDPDERPTEIWTPAGTFRRFQHERLVWHSTGALRAFELGLGELFKPI